MNNKRARRLRRAALGLAATLAEAGKDIKKDGYVVKKIESRYSSEDTNGPSAAKYQIMVRPDSVKAIYRNLKTGKL